MTIIEVFAAIIAAITLIKLTTILIRPRAWFNLVESIHKNKNAITVAYLILTIITGYFILQTFSIIEVGAITLFLMFFIGMALMPYINSILKIKDEVFENGLKKAWLPAITWTIFSLWILYAIFFNG